KMKSVYEWSGKVGKVAGNVAILLTFAQEVYKARKEAANIWESSDDGLTKAGKFSAMISGICIKTLWELLRGTTDFALWTLQMTKYANPGYWFDYAIGEARDFDEGVAYARAQLRKLT